MQASPSKPQVMCVFFPGSGPQLANIPLATAPEQEITSAVSQVT